MNLQTLTLSTLKPAPYNPRKISDDAMGRLEKSVKEWGIVDPLIVNKATGYTIIGGHQRFKVLQKQGVETADCVVLDLPPAKEKALNVALNNQKMAGEYEFSTLADILQEIDTGEFSVPELTGFSEEDLTEIANWTPDPEEGKEETEPIPETPEKAISQLGDLWELGEHRILCGNSTVPEDIDRLMEGDTPDMVLTDPPYGMGLDADYSDMKGFHQGKEHKNITGDDKPFDASTVLGVNGCKDQIWFGADYYITSLPSGGSWMVWDKRGDESADKMYGSCFELIWSSLKRKRLILRYKWAGFFTDGEERSFEHPTTKSVRLLCHLLEMARQEGMVYDPFCGSGTTIIAAEKLGRKCYAIEIEPRYVDVAVKRWQNYTGKKGKNLTRPEVGID
jgi:DNA modification methylase